jgi:hypothetical protein
MVTEKDIYIGLRFRVNDSEYEIVSKSTIQHIHSKSRYSGYTFKNIANRLNNDNWKLITPITKTYELW